MPAAAVVLCDVPRCPGYPASLLRPTCSCGDKVHGNCRLGHVCCARTRGRARPRSPGAGGRGRPRSRSRANDAVAQRRRIDGGVIEDDDESEDEDVVQPATAMAGERATGHLRTTSIIPDAAGPRAAGMMPARQPQSAPGIAASARRSRLGRRRAPRLGYMTQGCSWVLPQVPGDMCLVRKYRYKANIRESAITTISSLLTIA